MITKAAIVGALLFCFTANSQTYFSERLTVGGKNNAAYSFVSYLDTFFIPSFVIETSPVGYSCSLLKVDKTGNLISQKRFKPVNMHLSGGYDIMRRNNKFYLSSVSSYTMQIHAGYYLFDQNCDTVFTKYYGDTSYWSNGYKILPHLKSKNKLLLIGITDSTCGPPHSGKYKVFVRLVDTLGSLYQTNLYGIASTNRTIGGSDTTLDKGYIISGVQNNNMHYVLKLDSNLNQQWYITLPNSTGYITNSVAGLKNGDFVVSHTKTDSSGGSNFYDRAGITRLDKNGNVKWQQFYGTKQLNIAAQRIRVFSNGDYVVAGEHNVKYSSSAQQIKGFIFRTDSLGTLKWWNDYIPTTPVKDTIASTYLNDVLEIMPGKNIAAVGYQNSSGFFATIPESWLIYADSMGCISPGCTPVLTGIKEILNSELTIYPNPNNGLIQIEILNNQFAIENSEIKIISVLGQEMKRETLISKKQAVDISELNNGIYLLQLIQNNKVIATSKLIKQ